MRPTLGPIFRLILAILTCTLLSLLLLTFYGFYLPKLQTTNKGQTMEETIFLDKKVMKKKMNIVYLKTHKCASSSMQNIFLRFGERNNLIFVLPIQVGNYLGDGASKFSQSMVAAEPKQNNILCLHTRYNRKEMDVVMEDDTVYVTMLRDPIEVFESQWTFYGLQGHYGMTIDQFVLAPKTGKLGKRFFSRQGQNQMLWDLGLDEVENEELVRQKMNEVALEFDLVMIAEYFDESLVLMKETLGWDYEDVTSLKLNGRKEGSRETLNETTKTNLKEYLKFDYMLYNHFKQIFLNKLKDYGQHKMYSNLQKLEKVNSVNAEACSFTAVDNSDLQGDDAWWGPGLVGYQLIGREVDRCRLMIMPELKIVDRIRKRQHYSINTFKIVHN
eukprot:GFUD01002081.1.p1 GENE.GFUD01002081.1~~GFUD01002081.1.p1  ORF type:complete len:386 (+),score=88.88 GFUD01002081.1:41-1198(+)